MDKQKKIEAITKAIDFLQKAKMKLGARDTIAIKKIEEAQQYLLSKY